ncbi:hypothetical protein L873DRAFT_1869067 [Choiromyces venosus 120613-1]|uniref:Uncharacterized protein n=1 Tax=Choiromyces venosus 120613-1 TaxID=1336337 RepID=A0A3N4IZB7_9PEZI|nr:hypothetical protein L873DRAFT_1869067 [Choiromyces venosus 120613-1]
MPSLCFPRPSPLFDSSATRPLDPSSFSLLSSSCRPFSWSSDIFFCSSTKLCSFSLLFSSSLIRWLSSVSRFFNSSSRLLNRFSFSLLSSSICLRIFASNPLFSSSFLFTSSSLNRNFSSVSLFNLLSSRFLAASSSRSRVSSFCLVESASLFASSSCVNRFNSSSLPLSASSLLYICSSDFLRYSSFALNFSSSSSLLISSSTCTSLWPLSSGTMVVPASAASPTFAQSSTPTTPPARRIANILAITKRRRRPFSSTNVCSTISISFFKISILPFVTSSTLSRSSRVCSVPDIKWFIPENRFVIWYISSGSKLDSESPMMLLSPSEFIASAWDILTPLREGRFDSGKVGFRQFSVFFLFSSRE